MVSFKDLDAEVATLKKKHPGWNIWFVPRAPEHGGTIWCGVREPTINTDTPEHLSQEIEFAEKEHAASQPADAT